MPRICQDLPLPAPRHRRYARPDHVLLPRRYRQLPMHLADHLALGYMGVVGVLVVVFHVRVEHWYLFALFHATYLVVALELIRGAHRHPGNRVLGVARVFHPAVFFLFGYVELDALHALLFGEPWATPWLIRADLALFGTYPTVWVQRFYGSWADELLSATYLSYYLIGLTIAITWMVRGRREHVLAMGAIVGTTYVVNYGLFYLLPAEGPRFVAGLAELHDRSAQGYLFGPLCYHLMGDAGAIKAGCFPSSHVSGSIAYALACHRYGDRPLTLVFGGCAAGIFVGTVYLGYHYAVDPIAGVLTAWACYRVAVWALERRGEDPRTPVVGRTGATGRARAGAPRRATATS
jgi:membrane-associated phospholipid phosphatase